VIMAQIGGFTPASEATIGIVDRVFTRIGAADYLAFGQSTFMVEMNEAADILHNATSRSLVLLDEIGRGTSTFDGLAIAWAVTEYLHDKKNGPRTLFATHYHELVTITLVKEKVRNYNILVKETDGKIVFLHKIVPGTAGRSYGIQVAKLAGIPDPVISRAKEVLANLETEEKDPLGKPRLSRRKTERVKKSDFMQQELFAVGDSELLKELKDLEIENVTPLNALNMLAEWKKKFC
jgi:DNA mismatch repair protein MutS